MSARSSTGKKLERVTITIPEDLLEWLDDKVKERVYASRSHAFEVFVIEAKRKDDS
jgi:metal-responsive CopG/Arc/MetJ family transcriptional regulator